MCPERSKIVSSCLSVALFVMALPSFAAPTPAPALARLTGTVYTDDVKTPLAGATVVATDVNGVKIASQPTQADGVFTIAALTPGRTALSLETKEGTFAVATPVTLAPGEARGVRLAMKADSGTTKGKSKKKRGGPVWSGGAIAALTVVIVGFAAAAAVGINDMNDDNSTSPSPSLPEDK